MTLSVGGTSSSRFSFPVWKEDHYEIGMLLGKLIEELFRYYEANENLQNNSSLFEEFESTSNSLEDVPYKPLTLDEFFEEVRKCCPNNTCAKQIESIFYDGQWNLFEGLPPNMQNQVVILAIFDEKNDILRERLIPTYYAGVPFIFMKAAVAKGNVVMIEYLSRCRVLLSSRL